MVCFKMKDKIHFIIPGEKLSFQLLFVYFLFWVVFGHELGVFRSTVMYDRPPEMFKETTVNDRHRLFVELAEDYPVFRPK